MDNTQTFETNDAITTDQIGCHADLETIVARHRQTRWQKPIPEHTRLAADEALRWLREQGRDEVILDSFCGTGLSTQALTQKYPNAAVIGVDKSASRLGKHLPGPGCYRLLRAECEPFWRCLNEAGVPLSGHYLLYPNPWPKARQLKRRIHGHPAFPLIASLGGDIEIRSNWEIYIREFAKACKAIGISGAVDTVTPEVPLSLFERKYHERGQSLWRFRGQVIALQ